MGNRSPIVRLTLQTLLDALRSKGLRITHNRTAILQTLLASSSPMSLEEIREKALHEGHRPDYATVFRTMAALESLGLAKRVALNRSCAYFELVDPDKHQDHITCTECGRITLLEEECPVHELEEKIAAQKGYTQLTHSLEFFGVCPDCSAGRG